MKMQKIILKKIRLYFLFKYLISIYLINYIKKLLK